jgi:hypothetical protein
MSVEMQQFAHGGSDHLAIVIVFSITKTLVGYLSVQNVLRDRLYSELVVY